MKTCARKDCEERATHIPVIRCWADVDVHGPHEPIEATTELRLCREHGDQFVEEETAFVRLLAEKIDATCHAMGRASIDHDRTKVALVRLQ